MVVRQKQLFVNGTAVHVIKMASDETLQLMKQVAHFVWRMWLCSLFHYPHVLHHCPPHCIYNSTSPELSVMQLFSFEHCIFLLSGAALLRFKPTCHLLPYA
jgi:hypothetical protein